MYIKKIFLSAILPLIFLSETVSAHCPLCTVGAGAAAGAAVWLGVSKVVVALFLGAFAMSMGMWFARLLSKKKKYIPFQNSLVIVGVFLLTILPLISIVKVIGPLYLSFIGAYGKTYAFNYSIASSLLGGLVTFISPSFSKKLTKLRKGKIIPFQGVILTLSLLLVVGIIIQILI